MKNTRPTAAFESFCEFDSACAYVAVRRRHVDGASGLAAGRAVIAAGGRAAPPGDNRSEFEKSGLEVVIEENMRGEETIIFAYATVPGSGRLSSQDHKRVFDGDKGHLPGIVCARAGGGSALLGRIERRSSADARWLFAARLLS